MVAIVSRQVSALQFRLAFAGALIFLAILHVFGVRAASAAEPAFDCAKAEHEIEQLICGDDELAAQDVALAEIYAEALQVLEDGADAEEAIATLKTMQRGWIGGRDDCWKADDKRQCTADAYARRIAELQARYMLVEPGETVFYRCDDNSEIAATFMPTDLPTVRLERGDDVEIGWLTSEDAGERYDADFGVFLQFGNDAAQGEWPQGTALDCRRSQ